MKRQPLAVVADAAFLVGGFFVLYTALGGDIRWKTSLFRMTLTDPSRPIQICVLALLIKAVTGRQRGLFACLATTSLPIVRPVAASLHAADRRLRGLFLAHRGPLLLATVSAVLTLGVCELYLRYFPHTLPFALGNHVATGYHTGPSGIYRYVPELRMSLMHPNHERTMYFNGYRWRHKTDSQGFRNPVERATASVVLSGDSMVYGHGVEETSTVRHHLEAILEEPVVNLGMQASSIHHEYQVLKTFAPAFRPRHVFLFFLANDLDDLRVLTDAELSAFLQLPIADHSTPYFEVRARRAQHRAVAWHRAIESRLADLYVVKAFDFLRAFARARWLARAEAAEDPRSTLAMRFHLHALRKIQNLADQHHFAFVNVFTYTGVIPRESEYEAILDEFCRTHDIAFLSLRPAFERALRNGVDVFLPRDGHFADDGARLAAQELARYIERRSAPGPGR